MTRIERVGSEGQIAEVARLARAIWVEHYEPIVGRAQVDYMLEKFQSPGAIARQIAEGFAYHLARQDGRAVGYFAVAPCAGEGALLLSKLYVGCAVRGQGVGQLMLEAAEACARRQHCGVLWLTVNKHNHSSIGWYTRRGFRNAGSIVQDIGGGFVMDDYRMEKPVARVG